MKTPATTFRIKARRAIITVWVMLATASTPALAQQSDEVPTLQQARQVNVNSVEIVFHFEDYYRRLIDDIGREVGKDSDMRVIPVIGINHLQSLYDQLYLRGIDLSIVHSDVFEYLARSQQYDRVFERIHGLATLYHEKIAIIAGDQYGSLDELEGQKVNFGPLAKGADLAGTLIFDTLGIDVQPRRLEKFKAIEQVTSGELAATVFLMEDAPDQLMALKASDKVTVLPVPQTPELLNIYSKEVLNSKEFPNLIEAGDTIETLSASVIIASYNFGPADGWRYTRLREFVEAFVAGFDNLQNQPGYEEAWKQASLTEEIPGVPPLSIVTDLLERQEAERRRAAEAEQASEEAELMEAQKELTDRLEERMGDVEDPAELERLLEELQEILDEAK